MNVKVSLISNVMYGRLKCILEFITYSMDPNTKGVLMNGGVVQLPKDKKKSAYIYLKVPYYMKLMGSFNLRPF